MLSDARNTFVDGVWVLRKIEDRSLCTSFDCGDADLNEYFQIDAIRNKEELLGQCYYLHELSSPSTVIALLDFCNDSIHLEKYQTALSERKALPIDQRKLHRYLPAVKLTRFGVQKTLQGKQLGTHILNMVKKFFTTDNRTGCRFVTLDAYQQVIGFYEKCGFSLLTDKDKNKDTRSMFFDLKRLRM